MKTIALASVLLIGLSAAARADCMYADEKYSLGATICECPSMNIAGLNSTGANGRIISRRLECSTAGWTDTKNRCLDVSGHYPEETYSKAADRFCPRTPVNFKEVQDAVSRQPDKLASAMKKGTILAIVEAVCNRFKIGSVCSTFAQELMSANE